MKVELTEEVKYDENPWYVVRVDGNYVKGTGNKVVAEKLYNQILADPSTVKTKINILKSEEIDVSLDEQNQ
jgi:hypothetical protein